jgi:peptidase A4-like protein
MSATKFPSGVEVSTFEPPPPGFQPLKATDAELARHGFPRRPQDPQAMQRYETVLRRLEGKFQYIPPTFRRRDDIQHGPRRRIADTEQSSNWSGGVLYAPADQPFQCVLANWTIPNVFAPTQGQWYYCANWVGIDGDGGSGDVLQAGVECEVIQIGPFTIRNIYPWWEWYPEQEIQISNFPVDAGDEITCLIQADQGAGATGASVFMANQSSGASTSFSIQAPGGTQLIGNSAEWVVEAPTVNGNQAALADYGSVFFFDTICGDGTGLLEAGSGDNIDMFQGGNLVSEGVLVAGTVVQCLYTGAKP